MRQLAIISLLLMLLVPSFAQEGLGSIREGIADDLSNIDSLNPLRCDNQACFWAITRIFPSLVSLDPETRWIGAGTAENNGLAESWEISGNNLVYTFHLRDDAFWSDGTPITAYDFFYNYLAIMSRDFDSIYYDALRIYVEAVIPQGEKDLMIVFRSPSCDVLDHIYFWIAPAHVFDSEFSELAAAAFPGEDPRGEWEAWQDNFVYDFSFMREHPFDFNPSVTSGLWEFVDYQPYNHIRLKSADVNFELVPVQSRDEEVNSFLNGDLTILTNPPRNRWNDVLAAPDVQTVQTSGFFWDYLAFNHEDPENPQNAFDRDGNPIEQEPNPYFADIRVREAIQLAINVPELIEVGLQGQGTQLAGIFSPYSFAYDDSLQPYPHDPERARELLNEAGWVQQGDNRRCVSCGTAEEGTMLYLDLMYGSGAHHYEVATLIARQLYEVGINVNIYDAGDAVYYQDFDMYLGTSGAPYTNVSLDEMFSPAEDIVGFGWNFSSYNNPELSDLLTQARFVEGCDFEERIDYYQQAQQMLYDELPFAWLYGHDSRLAVRGSVQNFMPTLGEPLGNMRDWTVFDVPRRVGQ